MRVGAMGIGFGIGIGIGIALCCPACTASEHDAAAPTPAAATTLHEVRFQVDGMHCGSCAEAITAELATDAARQNIAVSHETRVAVFFVEGDAPGAATAAAKSVQALGFVVTPLAPGAPAGPVVTSSGASKE